MSAAVKVPFGVATLVAWMGVAFGTHGVEPIEGDSRSPDASMTSVAGASIYEGERLAMPVQIAVLDDRIVLADGYASTPIHVLDPDGRYLMGLGREGEGPGEFKWPRTLERAADGHGFWVFDAELSRLTLVVPERWNTVPASEHAIVSLHGPAFVTGVARRASGDLLATGLFSDGRIGHYTDSGAYESASGPLPSSEIEAPPAVLQHAYRGVLKADPAGERFVMANRHAGFLEVYSATGEPLRRIQGPFEFDPEFEVVRGETGPSLATGPSLRFGYIDVAPTSDRIYALFSGRTRAAHPDDATYGREVHVFDWDGRLLERIRLDADVIALAADAEGNRLLAVRHLPTPAVLSYPLAG